MVEIITIDDLVLSAAKVLNKEILIEEISFSPDFICTIEIKGEEHHGFVTYPIARFIVKLQDSARKLIRVHAEDISLQETRDIIKLIHIKAKVVDGSDFITLIFDKTFGLAMSHMTNDQIFWSIVLLIGTIFAKNITTIITSVKKKAKDEETKQRFIEFAEKALENSHDYHAAMQLLINKLSPGDTIKLHGNEEPLSKKEAKAIFPKIDPKKTETHYVDDTYEITDVSLDKLYVVLRKDQFRFSATTKLLADESRQKLYSAVKDAGVHEITAIMNLQVTLSLEGFNKEYYITGIGDKRPEAKNMADIATQHADSLLQESPAQGSLL